MLIVVNRDAAAHPVRIPVQHTALEGCKAFTAALGNTSIGTQSFAGDAITVNMAAFGFEVFRLR